MHRTSHSPYYLVRNARSCYCFRMVVPPDLRPVIGRSELKYSLGTGFLGVAKQKSRYVAGKVQLLFGILRRRGFHGMGKLSETQVPELVGKYIKKTISDLDSLYNQTVEGPESGDLIPLNPIHSLKDLEGHLGLLSGIREDLVVALSTGDFRMLEQPVGDLLRENGIDEVDKESSAYRRLAVAIFQEMTKLILIQQQHLRCDFSYR